MNTSIYALAGFLLEVCHTESYCIVLLERITKGI